MWKRWAAVGHAWRGIVDTWNGEHNFRLQVGAGAVAVAAALALHFDWLRLAVLLVVVGLVLAAEVLNTAIENMWAEAGFSETVRKSKDAAAGSVMVLALMAVAVGVALFFEPVMRALGRG